jgi:ribosomal protein L18
VDISVHLSQFLKENKFPILVVDKFEADYSCCLYQDQLRKAKKKIGEENIQKAVKTAVDAAEAALSEGKHFCVTHVDVGLDATAVREAVVKAMNRFKVDTTVQSCLKLFISSRKNYRFSILCNFVQQLFLFELQRLNFSFCPSLDVLLT